MTQTATKELITIKQLADRAHVKPTTLRRILRSQFPRKNKGINYSWEKSDPQIELILKAVENHKTNATQPVKKTEAPKAEKPKAVKTEKPVTKAVTKPVPKPEAKKTKNSQPLRKTVAQLKAEGVDIKPENIG